MKSRNPAFIPVSRLHLLASDYYHWSRKSRSVCERDGWRSLDMVFDFDLADTFGASRHTHVRYHPAFFGSAVLQTVAHLDDASLTRRQRFKHLLELLLQQREGDGIGRCDGVGVFDQITELGIAILAQRRVQGNRLTPVLLHFLAPSIRMSSSRASSSGVGSRPRS